MTDYRNITFLGIPNISAQGYSSFATDASTTPPTGLEASYLGTDEPSDKAQLPNLDPLHSQWSFNTGGLQVEIGGIAVVNHNLVPGDQIRFVASQYLAQPTLYPLYSLAPTSIQASSNITGTVTNVDEPISSPDGLVISPSPSPASTMSMRFGWPSFSPSFPRTDVTACFTVRVKLSTLVGGSGSTFSYPTIACELWENGVQKAVLGMKAISYQAISAFNGYEVFNFPFGFSQLVNADGRNLECKITLTPGHFPTSDQSGGGYFYVSMESITCYYDSASELVYNTIISPPGSASPVYDSGWLTYYESLLLDDSSPSVKVPQKNLHYFPLPVWAAVTSMAIMFRADRKISNPASFTQAGTAYIPYGARIGGTSPNITVGCIPIGKCLTLVEGIPKKSLSLFRVATTQSAGGSTIGGQSFGSDEFRRRVCDSVDIIASEQETELIQHNIAWTRGLSGAFYVAVDPDNGPTDSVKQEFGAAWVTQTQDMTQPKLLIGGGGAARKYQFTMSLSEKL